MNGEPTDPAEATFNGIGPKNSRAANKRNTSGPNVSDQWRRARVLCSYDANDHTELTLTANEVI